MKLYTISGLGADEKVLEKLTFNPEIEVVHIPWLIPEENEDFHHYVSRMANTIDHPEPFYLLGYSFGGIIVQEIHKLKPAKRIVILGSIRCDAEKSKQTEVFNSNVNAIIDCDIIFAVTDDKDMGTIWVSGFAYALKMYCEKLGIKEKKVIIKHVLRNSLIPVVTYLGMEIPLLIGGAVVTEQVFSWPGIGSLMIKSIDARDYPVVMGITVLVAIAVLVFNILTDLVYGILDPRIRYN
jgi:hypothetical protein